ncbi:elongation of very long chain fatty acids protein-like protein [Leptotrombidium deliense]|uniref:Elongation of very long chain fatty acids protein n=1 Tax=Leptotrombidium deliense TaxID=299467 RepID=A0A443SJJ9_9ACAR|nr:elongation of very long chain fatty acids protein-like protein [Leptotrombidium deliense]
MELVRYYFYDFWEEIGAPRVSNLPLIHGGPWKVCAIVGLYLYFVNVLGPQFMKNRPAYDLRIYMLLYNSFLVGFNGVGFFIGLWVTDYGWKAIDCTRYDPNPTDIKESLYMYFGWLYFISKLADFIDTAFFILRKKESHVTFLHVFHHSVMPLIGYFGLKIHPGPYCAFMPLLNVFVHAVMYFYYALSAAGPSMKKHLWWKKQITQIQMVQFSLTLIHSINGLQSKCQWPKWLAVCEGLHAVIFIVMFSAFYKQAYLSKPSTKSLKSQ